MLTLNVKIVNLYCKCVPNSTTPSILKSGRLSLRRLPNEVKTSALFCTSSFSIISELKFLDDSEIDNL